MDTFILPEILVHIFSFIVDPSTLLTLRLVCSAWQVLVESQIQKVLYVSLTQLEHRNRLAHCEDEVSRRKIRSFVLNVPDRDYWTFRGTGDRILITHKLYPFFRQMAHLVEHWVPKFPNLQHLSVHFRPVARLSGPFACTERHKANFLTHMMGDIFRILQKMESLDELSLQSLPVQAAFPLDGPPNSFTLPDVTGAIENLKLKTLKLAFVGTDVWPPVNPNHSSQETVENYDSFGWPEIWVQHAKDTLRHLSLTCWGFYMRDIPKGIDPELITIPNLESLELGSIAFTSDAPLKWILSHAPTLRSLVFQDCAMLFSMEYRGVLLDGRPNSICSVQWDPQQRWDQWFKEFQAKLLGLEHFGFGSRRVRFPGEEGPVFVSELLDGPAFWKREKFLFGLFPDRYIDMAGGVEACPWILRPPRFRHFRVPTNGRLDHAALRDLLRTIGQVVEENDNSTHAAYVDCLSGRVRCVEVGEEEGFVRNQLE